MDILAVVGLILLGAAVAAAGAFAWTRIKVNDNDVVGRSRRAELLEDVAGHVGKVSHVFARYAALVNDSFQFDGNVPIKLQTELDEVTRHLVLIFEEISAAESKLLLLGEKRLEKALRLYSAKLAYFRNNFPPGHAPGPDKDIGATKKDIAKLRAQFYDILSERYDSAIRE